MAKYPYSSKPTQRDCLSDLGIALLYAVFAAAWIIFSDKAVEALFSTGEDIALAGTLKGWLFVAVTSLLLYGLLRHRRREYAENTAEALSEGLITWPRWALYAFAVAVSVATLLIRVQIAAEFENRPLFIILIFPVILSAVLGGLGPGLLATLMVAVGIAFFSNSPATSFDQIARYELIQWGFLIVNGTLVSFLAELMRRSRGRAGAAQMERLNALKLLEAIADSSEDAIFALDRTGHYVLFNRAAERITGRRAHEVLGHDESMLFPLAMAQNQIADNRSVMESGVGRTFEETVPSTAGERTFLVAKSPLRDETGQITGLFGIARDITDRKQAEAALAASEKRFHDIVEASADWVWEVDAEGRYIYASESVQELLGYTAEEIIGKTPFDLMPPAEAERVRAEFAAIAAKRKPFRDLDNVNVRKDGTACHVQTNGMPIFDVGGNLIGYRGLDRDVTADKLAELGLRESEARFRALFDNAAVAIMIHDRETGAILDANRRAIESYGLATLEELQRWDIWLEPPYSYEDAVALIHKAASEGPQRYEWKVRDYHGRIFWEDVLLNRMTLSGTERVLSITTDITARKDAEEVLSHQASELRNRNEELERFNRAMVGRELDMIALKRQVNELARWLGDEAPYRLDFADSPDEAAKGEDIP